MMRDEKLKITVVGDGGVGKTCLIITYLEGGFPGEYIPTVTDNCETETIIDGKQCTCSIWDTAGQEDYDRLRPLSYPQTDVFVLCFSVLNYATEFHYTSYEAVQQQWLPEVSHHCPGTPILLVGCKIDIRDRNQNEELPENQRNFFSYADGLKLAEEIGAKGYIECSSYSHKGINAVFREAVRIARAYQHLAPHTKKSNCSVS